MVKCHILYTIHLSLAIKSSEDYYLKISNKSKKQNLQSIIYNENEFLFS